MWIFFIAINSFINFFFYFILFLFASENLCLLFFDSSSNIISVFILELIILEDFKGGERNGGVDLKYENSFQDNFNSQDERRHVPSETVRSPLPQTESFPFCLSFSRKIFFWIPKNTFWFRAQFVWFMDGLWNDRGENKFSEIRRQQIMPVVLFLSTSLEFDFDISSDITSFRLTENKIAQKIFIPKG